MCFRTYKFSVKNRRQVHDRHQCNYAGHVDIVKVQETNTRKNKRYTDCTWWYAVETKFFLTRETKLPACPCYEHNSADRYTASYTSCVFI